MANGGTDLKQKLAERTDGGNQKDKGQGDTVFALVERLKPQIQRALPQHIGLERFTRIAMTTIRQDPKLLTCDTGSLLGAIMQAAQLGLEPNILGSCYILPFNNKRTGRTEANFIIGYRGMIDLARRSGNLRAIYAHEVRENDDFEYEYGLNPQLKHKPALAKRGPVIGYYAVAHFKDGGYQFEFMPVEEIEKRKQRSPAANAGSSPWKTDYDEMAKKTVVRHMFKYLPVAVEREIHEAGFNVDQDERPLVLEDDGTIDVVAEPVDEESGVEPAGDESTPEPAEQPALVGENK